MPINIIIIDTFKIYYIQFFVNNMQNKSPFNKTLVLIGGGHSHVEVIKQLGMKPIEGLRVVLISRNFDTPYSGMLPGYLAGHYDYDECHIDLSSLTQFSNVTFICAEVKALDVDDSKIHLNNRPSIHFDLLSINIGSRPKTLTVSGAIKNSILVKPIDKFIDKWKLFLEQTQLADRPLNIAVVGGGAGGVELILSSQFRINTSQIKSNSNSIQHHFHLFAKSKNILPTYNNHVRDKFLRILSERGIAVYTEHDVTEIQEDSLQCANGFNLPVDIAIWVTNAAAPSWVKDSGIDTDADGFIKVNDFLQSVSHKNIFAVGDISSPINHVRPKSGVFAVRQGPYLSKNLRNVLFDHPLTKFTPQKKFLSLISSGNKYAVASRGILTIEGKWVWILKDWIDRRFINKYNDLPQMTAKSKNSKHIQSSLAVPNFSFSDNTMRCCGCGAKIGSSTLQKVISKLNPVQNDDVLFGLHDPDDAAAIKLPKDKILVQSVDYFRALIDDEYLFGKIAANHALGDIFAMGASAHTAMAIATIPYASETIMEQQLYQVLSGAVEVLNEAGCSLIGGHSGEGTELAFGLSINGITDPTVLLRKNTLRPEHVLILTKPIGTGTLFAANMRRKCKGKWVESALDSMMQSNKTASEIFIYHGASACTDITGFGLMGHLVEMLDFTAKILVTLDLDALPILDGALETISNEIFSSLYEKNLDFKYSIADFENIQHQKFPLLFDPQTAGGLLACVPKNKAEECIKKLHKENYSHASIMGYITKLENTSRPLIAIRN